MDLHKEFTNKTLREFTPIAEDNFTAIETQFNDHIENHPTGTGGETTDGQIVAGYPLVDDPQLDDGGDLGTSLVNAVFNKFTSAIRYLRTAISNLITQDITINGYPLVKDPLTDQLLSNKSLNEGLGNFYTSIAYLNTSLNNLTTESITAGGFPYVEDVNLDEYGNVNGSFINGVFNSIIDAIRNIRKSNIRTLIDTERGVETDKVLHTIDLADGEACVFSYSIVCKDTNGVVEGYTGTHIAKNVSGVITVSPSTVPAALTFGSPDTSCFIASTTTHVKLVMAMYLNGHISGWIDLQKISV